MDYCGECINYRKVNEKRGRCKAKRASFYITPKSCLGCQNYKAIDIEEVLHSPFDPGIHANVFGESLEVVITPDGVIHYAIPSYSEFVKWWAKEFLKITPKNLDEAGCIVVWANTKIGPVPNDEQKESLRLLQKNGLYLGEID